MDRCTCRCHSDERADHREELHRASDWPKVFSLAQLARWTRPSVDVMDAIGAAVACSECKPVHCAALLTRTIWARYAEPTLTTYSTPDDPKSEGQE